MGLIEYVHETINSRIGVRIHMVKLIQRLKFDLYDTVDSKTEGAHLHGGIDSRTGGSIYMVQLTQC